MSMGLWIKQFPSLSIAVAVARPRFSHPKSQYVESEKRTSHTHFSVAFMSVIVSPPDPLLFFSRLIMVLILEYHLLSSSTVVSIWGLCCPEILFLVDIFEAREPFVI